MAKPEHAKTVKINIASLAQSVPHWGNPNLDQQHTLSLIVLGTTQNIRVDFAKRNTYTLGRADQAGAKNPDIDLGAFKARQLGVSRRHAQLELHDTTVYITDLESTNATYLNGAKLPAHQPTLLRDGDVIWLGQLKLYVRFGSQLENKHLSVTWSTRTKGTGNLNRPRPMASTSIANDTLPPEDSKE